MENFLLFSLHLVLEKIIKRKSPLASIIRACQSRIEKLQEKKKEKKSKIK